MNTSKRLIINCGASKVTAAEVYFDDGNLQVDRLVTVDLIYDASDETAMLPSIGEALKTLSKEHRFSGLATLIIPGNFVLTRIINIPHTEESKRAQIIAFEAQQNLPYSLSEVVWDSQVVNDDDVETEILFIAAKSVIVSNLCDYMVDAGFQVEKISAATVLDYNTMQFVYPEMEDDVLLINIGARSTNLLFSNSEGFLARNIQLGGNSLTQSIADNLGRSFIRAEQIKQKFFSEKIHADDDDTRVKMLNSCGESFVRRLNQEITLSILNYKRQKKGEAPKRILLNGQGSLLNGLADQLSESQETEVGFFDPLLKVSLDGSVEVEKNALSLQISEIVGEACHQILSKPSGVNLLPEAIQKEMALLKKKPFFIASAACLALSLFPPFLHLRIANATYSDQVEIVQNELHPLAEKQSQIRSLQEESNNIIQSIQGLEGLVNSRSNWIRLFADLQESLYQAKDVWLDQLDMRRGQSPDGEPTYEVVIEGRLLVREAVNGLDSIDQNALSGQIKSLRESFEDSEFIISSRPPVVVFTNLRKGLYVLPFSINLIVDPSKSL